MDDQERRCIIGDLMKEKNLTQTQLSKLSGVPQSAISRYSRGSSRLYDINHLFRLKQALETPDIDSLFI